jgi:class 3 adenylate cyclase/tetratricopeptide (TPR) repeat protein
MDVSAWLKLLGLAEYAPAFKANHVDWATLKQLTADDLRDIGVGSVGHRRRLLGAIGELDEAPKQAERPAHPDAERRPVTVLFADLCGFTALSRELPDEAIHGMLDRFLAVADEAVRQNGGTVDKHIGDAVMALFGAPVAHDDDMLRALRAAAQLCERMPDLSREIGRKLLVHAGIASGDVIVGTSGSGYTAIGEAVNLAARLTDLAPPGEIFVSEPVWRETAGRAKFEAQSRRTVKGFADPVGVWKLLAMSQQDESGFATPFVGRTGELAQITALLESCATGGGAIVYVRGEPGIGKSRLVHEASAAAARRGMSCHIGHVLDFGAGHQGDLLRRLADSLLGLRSDASPGDRLAAAQAVAEARPTDAALEPFLYELAGAPLTPALRGRIDASDERMRREKREEALSFLVERALAERPVLLIIEDLHWADPSLAQALSRLAHMVTDRPLVLTLTSRPENERLYDALRAQAADAPLVTIDLRPLRAQDAATIVTHLTPLPEAVQKRCIERAGGNPLFLEQLLRNAAEAAGDLPPSLRGLVVARVDRLNSLDRAAIHAAAVLGDRFDPAALKALIGAPGYDAAGLLRTGLLRMDKVELSFAHALIREAVLRSLLADPRKKLHALAADWFEGRDPTLRALHLDHAEAPAAPEAYRLAAAERLRQYRPAEALPLVERGLLLAAAADVRAALLVIKGDVLLDSGRAREALTAYQEALAEGDERERSLALLGSASARRILDELDSALDDVEKAQALAENGGWLDIKARCHFVRGNLFFPLGRVDECLREHQAALEHAELSGDAEAKARALGGLGDAEYARGNMLVSGDYFRRCVEESRRIGLGRVEVSNLPMYGHALFLDLRLEESLAEGEEAIALALSVGQKRAEMIAHHLCIGPLLELGRAEEARPHVERAQTIVRELEAWRFEPENLAFLAEIELERGRPDLARPLVAEGLDIARKTAMSYWGPALLAFNARLASEAEAREAFIAEAETLLGGKVLAHNHFLARRSLVELGLALRLPTLVEEQCDKLASFSERSGKPMRESMPLADFLVRRGRVLAAALRGEHAPKMAADAQALLDWAAQAGAVRLRRGLDEALEQLRR